MKTFIIAVLMLSSSIGFAYQTGERIGQNLVFTVSSPIILIENFISGISEGSDQAIRGYKIVIAAQDDAAYFVAMNGEDLPSAQLQAALDVVRQNSQFADLSDIEIAALIASAQ